MSASLVTRAWSSLSMVSRQSAFRPYGELLFFAQVKKSKAPEGAQPDCKDEETVALIRNTFGLTQGAIQ
jgi:hypothetical protein